MRAGLSIWWAGGFHKCKISLLWDAMGWLPPGVFSQYKVQLIIYFHNLPMLQFKICKIDTGFKRQCECQVYGCRWKVSLGYLCVFVFVLYVQWVCGCVCDCACVLGMHVFVILCARVICALVARACVQLLWGRCVVAEQPAGGEKGHYAKCPFSYPPLYPPLSILDYLQFKLKQIAHRSFITQWI